MKIKKGDNVKVIRGSGRGKIGRVIQVLHNKQTRQHYVVIENVNMRKKHLRSSQRGEKGQIIELAAPIHVSNVMLVDPQTNTPTRVGYKQEGSTKKRVATKSREFIDS